MFHLGTKPYIIEALLPSFHLNLFAPHIAAGQRHISDPSSQEPDERRGADRQSFLRSFHQVPEGVRHGCGQLARGFLAHEGTREEASGKAGEAGGVSNARTARLPEETHLPRPGSQRIQGHGLLLRGSRKNLQKE